MDLGIAGRKAIVCASSRGLGRACAQALAQAGCEVVINGLDAARLEATAAELQKANRRQDHSGQGRCRQRGGPGCFVCRLSGARHSGQQQCRTATTRVPRPHARADARGRDRNMVVAIELVQKAVGPMQARGFGRIVNITSGTVKLPQAGLIFPPRRAAD